eukprot:COSAG02_NODE_9947_length_2068_cov_1.325038_1_plen_127_part_00
MVAVKAIEKRVGREDGRSLSVSCERERGKEGGIRTETGQLLWLTRNTHATRALLFSWRVLSCVRGEHCMRLLALSLSLGWVGAQDYSICSNDPSDPQLTAHDADPPAECNTVRAQALPPCVYVRHA